MEDQAKKIRPKRTMEMVREQRRLAVEKYIGGRDIVSWCLEEPQHFQDNPPLQNVLLGRHAFIFDTSDMIKRLTKGKVRYHEALSGRAEHPDTGCFPIDIVAWKLAYCDGATVKDEEDLERLYQERLRDEELQPPIERARELARRESEKAARRNAKWMIPAIEKLDPKVIEQARNSILDNSRTLEDLWRQVSPPPPQWIQAILKNDQPWGFVIYRTAEVEKKYGHKWFPTEENDWQGTWGYINEEDRIGHGPLDKRDRQYTTNSSIHYGGRLDRVGELETLMWPQTDDEGARGIHDADGFREHFRQYRETLTSPGVLRNTLIIIDKDAVDNFITGEHETFRVWAYDADWQPPSAAEIEEGTSVKAKQVSEGYEGRLGVTFHSLSEWLYCVRVEGTSLYDMWLKREKEWDGLWHGHTKYMEQWDHEPFV